VQADVFQGRYSPQHYNPLGIAVLNLGNNQINALSPHSFEHLPNLTELSLNNNPLQTLNPATLMSLASPERLQVSKLKGKGICYI
jgi:Leucine-rich repeat (LRR) protein